MNRWIGVDFDHTLCRSDGSPIREMVELVQEMLRSGIEVRLVTARMAPENFDKDAVEAMHEWCLDHLGTFLTAQWGKSPGMVAMIDDLAIRVQPDTGKICNNCQSRIRAAMVACVP